MPRTGPYTLHKGETVVPANEEFPVDENADMRLEAPDTEGKVPGFQPQPEDVERERQFQQNLPGGQKGSAKEQPWFVDQRSGVPYQAKKNDDPEHIWRLVYGHQALADAWRERGKQGYPILLRQGDLEARDWLVRVDKARAAQYDRPNSLIDIIRSQGEADAGPMFEDVEQEQGEAEYPNEPGIAPPAGGRELPTGGPPGSTQPPTQEEIDEWEHETAGAAGPGGRRA